MFRLLVIQIGAHCTIVVLHVSLQTIHKDSIPSEMNEQGLVKHLCESIYSHNVCISSLDTDNTFVI